MRRLPLAFLLVALLPGPTRGEEPTVWIEVDGASRLEVEWLDGSLAIETDDGRRVLEAGAISVVAPGVHYDAAFEARVDRALDDLGAAEYDDRVAATAFLLELGTRVGPRLARLAGSSDPEVAERAAALLERIEAGEGGRLPPPRLDRIVAAGETLEGRLVASTGRFRWRGREATLDWPRLRLSAERPADERAAPADGPPVRLARLEAKDFPAEDRRLDFDTDATGAAIAAGADVEMSYADWGCVFDSEIETTVIHADGYVVGSVSGRQSGSTRTPRWQGHVLLTVFLPGTIDPATRRGVPAGVHRVGVYVAHVMPGGTGLRAYGVDGRLLTDIETDDTGTDFLGIESPVPIHRVEIYDDPTIDNNFTTDDWRLGPTVSTDGHPEAFVVETTGGERIVVPGLAGDEAALRLSPFGDGPPDAVPLTEVRRILAPTAGLRLDAAGAPPPVGPGRPTVVETLAGRTSGRVTAWSAEGLVLETGGPALEIPWSRILVVEFAAE